MSSTTSDADLFLIVQLFDPDGNEVTFEGSTDPNTPIANGWLRASHRALDPDRSKPWQPFHPHDRVEPLEPGVVYELDIEIVPTCIVVPAGTGSGSGCGARTTSIGARSMSTVRASITPPGERVG